MEDRSFKNVKKEVEKYYTFYNSTRIQERLGFVFLTEFQQKRLLKQQSI